jgi:hypothetical protein
MEDRKFTLRIGAEESAALEELKSLTGEATDTGVIRFIIRGYKNLNDRYLAEKSQNFKLTAQVSGLRDRTDTFLSAFNALSHPVRG